MIQHIPEFTLYDAYATRYYSRFIESSQWVGAGAGDLMIWPDTDKTMAELIAGIAKLKPSQALQSIRLQQLNVCYGRGVSRVSGKDWRDFVEQEMFVPLAWMTQTGFTYSRQQYQLGDWAYSNGRRADVFCKLSRRFSWRRCHCLQC